MGYCIGVLRGPRASSMQSFRSSSSFLHLVVGKKCWKSKFCHITVRQMGAVEKVAHRYRQNKECHVYKALQKGQNKECHICYVLQKGQYKECHICNVEALEKAINKECHVCKALQKRQYKECHFCKAICRVNRDGLKLCMDDALSINRNICSIFFHSVHLPDHNMTLFQLFWAISLCLRSQSS